MKPVSRRGFLRQSAAAGAGLGLAAATAPAALRPHGANDRVIVGVMGLRGRGSWLVRRFGERADVEVAYLCDVDRRQFERNQKNLTRVQEEPARLVGDFRRILEDPDVDALVNATPDHWHALPTVLACQAGKDVYVEKPASHNLWEGRQMVAAARKYGRIVQLGTQTRSAPYARAAIEHLRSGQLGEIHLVKIFNMKNRGRIPGRPDGTVPAGLDYDMWLGAAPERRFNPNHASGGHWYWYWEYSGGDIICDGVHQMDVGRWFIDRRYPLSVYSAGGKHHLDDDPPTPDTMMVTYEYDRLTLVFELTLWTPYMKKSPAELRASDTFPHWPHSATRVEVYGSRGQMMFGRHGGGWQVWDGDGKVVASRYGRQPGPAHVENFVECVRSRARPNADIEEGHLSTLLCHLGNISYRVGKKHLVFDGETEHFRNSKAANALLKRDYREPWAVPAEV